MELQRNDITGMEHPQLGRRRTLERISTPAPAVVQILGNALYPDFIRKRFAPPPRHHVVTGEGDTELLLMGDRDSK